MRITRTNPHRSRNAGDSVSQRELIRIAPATPVALSRLECCGVAAFSGGSPVRCIRSRSGGLWARRAAHAREKLPMTCLSEGYMPFHAPLAAKFVHHLNFPTHRLQLHSISTTVLRVRVCYLGHSAPSLAINLPVFSSLNAARFSAQNTLRTA